MAHSAAVRAFPLGACLAVGGGLLVVGWLASLVGGLGNLLLVVGGTVAVAFVRDLMRGRRGEGPFANAGGEDPAPDPVEVSFEDWFAGRDAGRGY